MRGRGVFFIYTKFHDIWKYESKVMALYVNFFCNRATRADKKNHFFQKKNIEIGFLELYIHGKL